MDGEHEVELHKMLQTERISGRHDWSRYVALKTQMNRALLARIEAELAPIQDALRTWTETRGAGARQTASSASCLKSARPETPTPTRRSAPGRSRRPRSSC